MRQFYYYCSLINTEHFGSKKYILYSEGDERWWWGEGGGRVLRSKKTLQLEHTMQNEKDYKKAPKGTPELWNFLTVSTEQRGNSLFIGKYVINTFR